MQDSGQEDAANLGGFWIYRRRKLRRHPRWEFPQRAGSNLLQFLQMLVDPMNMNEQHGLEAYVASKERRESSKKKSFKTLFCSTFLANSLTNSYGTRPHSCRKLFWNTLVVVRRSWNVVLFLHSARKCGTRVLACVAQSCKLSDALLQDTLQDHSRFWTDSCGTHALILMTPVWDSCKLQDTLLERAGKTPL